MLKPKFLILILVVVAVIAASTTYYTLRTSLEIPEAENLVIEGIKVNREASVMTGVVVKNIGDKPVTVEKIVLIRVQTGLVVCSSTINPPAVIQPGETEIVRVSCELDHYYKKEGCDYKVLAVTSEGKAAKYVFGYPMTLEELGFAVE
ncbi:MAG: hypothetical protein DRO46_00785 [Candidatus Hecatellales archaeon]|nr:MAG: hypothetical protein DRO46_00785 [Candidatus Hecatellales archaeon]